MYDYDSDHNDDRGYSSPEPPMPADVAEEPDRPKPRLQMVGTDGNVFAIIGRVAKCLRRHGGVDLANEWVAGATSCTSYDEVLALMYKYVDPY